NDETPSDWKVLQLPVAADTFKRIKDGMWGSVNNSGTGHNAAIPGVDICGKTGTVQVIGNDRRNERKKALAIDHHSWYLVTDYVVPLYIGGVLGLALVLVAGHSVHANKSWLYGVQPSELAKVLTIAALAKYYSQIGRDYLELPELFKGGMIVALPMSLVMLQGDLGTAITFVPIFLALSFIAGLKRK